MVGTENRNLRRVGGPPRKPASVPKAKVPTPVRRTRSGGQIDQNEGTSASVNGKKGPATPASSSVKTASIAQDEHSEEEEMEMEEVHVAAVDTPRTRSVEAPSDYEVVVKTEPIDFDAGPPVAGSVTGTEEDEPYDYRFEEEAEAGPSGTTGEEMAAPVEGGPIVITIGENISEEARKRRLALENRKKPLTAGDRALRLEAHKFHIITLIANGSIRNRWISDTLLKARLLSLTPHHLHQAFHIPPSQHPDVSKRSRLFLSALQNLATWWANDFFEVPPDERSIGLRTRTWDEVMDIVDKLPRLAGHMRARANGKGKEKAIDVDMEGEDEEHAAFVAALGKGGEKIRTVKSLQKKALQGFGSRDTSSQLFVSLCRAMGQGARLVMSLQPVPWKAEKSATPKKPTSKASARRKGKMPGKTESEEEEEEEMEEIQVGSASEGGKPQWKDTGAKGFPQTNGQTLGGGESKPNNVGLDGASNPVNKHVNELYKLKKQKPQKYTLASPKKKPKKESDLSTQPPVFWAEVYSRPDQRWIPVDPVRGVVKRKKDFEPSTDSGPVRMLYVVAFEEDGYAREVTVRYTKSFGAKTSKMRVPTRKGKKDWWERVMKILQRPYRLNRDDLEDAELQTSQISEGMPMNMNGFQDHPLFVLERHLKRDEIILPKREVGKFKGESVYRRENVISLKSPETWMRVGRRIRAREEALKWVKQRAVTLDKRRAIQAAEAEGTEPLLQGLYAEWQTELLIPPPIKDGVIPTNSFGNIDLYVPTMLPKGAVHLPYKGIAKVAKQLGIKYAEACTGFEFKKQRAIPTITGVVVAEESEETLLEAYWESAAAAEERALTKKQEQALKRWQRLIKGIEIRQRLQEQYGGGAAPAEPVASTSASPAPRKKIRPPPKRSGTEGPKISLVGRFVAGGSGQGGTSVESGVTGAQEPGGFEVEPGGFEVEPGGFEQEPGGFEQEPGGFEVEQEPGGFEVEEEAGGFEREAEVEEVGHPVAGPSRGIKATDFAIVQPPTRGSKRKAAQAPTIIDVDDSEGEAEFEEVQSKGKKSRPSRATRSAGKGVERKVVATTGGGSGRSMRTRGNKTVEEEERERIEAEAIKRALESDDEEIDED